MKYMYLPSSSSRESPFSSAARLPVSSCKSGPGSVPSSISPRLSAGRRRSSESRWQKLIEILFDKTFQLSKINAFIPSIFDERGCIESCDIWKQSPGSVLKAYLAQTVLSAGISRSTANSSKKFCYHFL